MVGRPALIIYSFAPKETPSSPELAASAHDYLKQLWQYCDTLNVKDTLPGSPLSTQFPQAIEVSNPLFRLTAAKVDLNRRARQEDYQAFLFEYQDIVGFIATLESNIQLGSLSQWQVLLSEWTTHINSLAPGEGIMEETYLFTALHEGDSFSSSEWLSDEHFAAGLVSDLGERVMAALPGSDKAPWRAATASLTASGYCLWSGEHLNGRRTAAVIAPHSQKDELFSWTVWLDQHLLAPFASYLMYAAKLRFTQRVFESDAGKLHETSRLLDGALSRLIAASLKDAETWDLDKIEKAQDELINEQIRSFPLLYGISKLKELILTARIAIRNMQKFVPAMHPGMAQPENGLFEQDRARGLWLRKQMEMDLGYLRALRQRIQEGHRLATLLLERESQRTGRRLNSLVLLQGTMLGSITIGLLMLPAFEAFQIPHGLVWSVAALLMATALALPPLFARWHENYRKIEHVAGGLWVGALGFLGVTVWEFLLLPSIQASRMAYVAFRVFVFVFGFLLGYLGVRRMEKLKSRLRIRKERRMELQRVTT